ncbi:MAG: hypothetical protein A2202_02930 [Bdellovibrionales bacterium RIFOXYA1_FULL_36_14]|nr:MAG: hypothetical protein A2202_02930 [Bdellovibrionales bacterium RIFOXYA1_FULL_36_14]
MMINEDKKSLLDGLVKDVKEEKKKSRKSKNDKDGFKINKEQTRFIVDQGSNVEGLGKIFEQLEKANNKEYGRKISFKDLAVYGITKIKPRDIEKIQESSMTKMEKVERVFNAYKSRIGEGVTLEKLGAQKLNIALLV